MICTIEDGKIKCVLDRVNTVYKPDTPENRQALGLVKKPARGRPRKVEEGEE